MTGVEILTATEVVVATTCNWLLGGIVFLICIVIGGIISFCSSSYQKGAITIAGALTGMLIGILVGGVTCAITETPTEYETQYKVTVSDEVPINEFYEKYEVIDQEGKIFTVREKGGQ